MVSTQLDDAGWKQHMIDCNNKTYPTNSDKVCYTCLTVPCWVNRKLDFRALFPAKKNPERGQGRDWRQELDKATSSLCKDYKKIMSRLKAAGATVLLRAPTTQTNSPEMEEIKLHCLKSCGA